MKWTPSLILLGLCITGYLIGSTAARISAKDELTADQLEQANVAIERQSSKPLTRSRERERSPKVTALDTSQVRSNDTLDSLKEVPATELYGRLSLWLLDATPEEIAAYWQFHQANEKRDPTIDELILVNWTRLDPQAAISAVAGTPNVAMAWVAWSSSDPIAALNAAVEKAPSQLNSVAAGIGEFHPEWLMEHIDDIPASAKDAALQGLAKWDDVEDPAKYLTFLSNHGFGLQPKMLMLLTKRDPWAAFDWVKKYGKPGDTDPFSGPSSNAFGTFAQTIRELDPELLQRFANNAPPGDLKQQLENAVFGNLIDTDPEAARAQVLSIEAPIERVRRSAQLVIKYAQENPDFAFSTVEELLTKNPNALNTAIRITYGDGNGSSNNTRYTRSPHVGEVSGMISSLVASDPERLMGMLTFNENDYYSTPFHQATEYWLENDVDAFMEWADRQDNPLIFESTNDTVIGQLTSKGRYEEAAAKSISTTDAPSSARLSSVLMNWSGAAPEEAMNWLEQSGLPQEQIDLQKQNLNRRH